MQREVGFAESFRNVGLGQKAVLGKALAKLIWEQDGRIQHSSRSFIAMLSDSPFIAYQNPLTKT